MDYMLCSTDPKKVATTGCPENFWAKLQMRLVVGRWRLLSTRKIPMWEIAFVNGNERNRFLQTEIPRREINFGKRSKQEFFQLFVNIINNVQLIFDISWSSMRWGLTYRYCPRWMRKKLSLREGSSMRKNCPFVKGPLWGRIVPKGPLSLRVLCPFGWRESCPEVSFLRFLRRFLSSGCEMISFVDFLRRRPEEQSFQRDHPLRQPFRQPRRPRTYRWCRT